MRKCLVCGKESESWLCAACQSYDKEKLCHNFCVYHFGCGENKVWDALAEFINNDIAFEITDTFCSELCDGLKAYYRVLYLAKNNRNIKKTDVEAFLENAKIIFACDNITVEKKNRINGLLLDVYTNMHDYPKADSIAKKLLSETEMPKQASHSLIVFFIRTRRYDIAEKLIKAFLEDNSTDDYCSAIEKEYEDLKRRRDGGKKEYLPNGENADNYFAFLDEIGVSYTRPRIIPKPIPKSEYPKPQGEESVGFKDFVAFDVETTGLDMTKDSIIELSAVKVKDGVVVDSFSELVRPIDKHVPNEVVSITGITDEEVQNAREIWEVFPDFAEFIGENILVGYNSLAFDSHFLVRAGRYSHIIPKNTHFDAMKYSLKFKKQLGITKAVKLVELGTILGIENVQAHRALSDAETTAKIYLKLLEF